MRTTLTRDDEFGYRLAGDLTFATIPTLHDNAAVDFSGDTSRIDLGEVQHVDSAGLALLLEWVQQAAQAGRQIDFVNVPTQLRSLVEVTGLAGVLRLQD